MSHCRTADSRNLSLTPAEPTEPVRRVLASSAFKQRRDQISPLLIGSSGSRARNACQGDSKVIRRPTAGGKKPRVFTAGVAMEFYDDAEAAHRTPHAQRSPPSSATPCAGAAHSARCPWTTRRPRWRHCLVGAVGLVAPRGQPPSMATGAAARWTSWRCPGRSLRRRPGPPRILLLVSAP